MFWLINLHCCILWHKNSFKSVFMILVVVIHIFLSFLKSLQIHKVLVMDMPTC